MTKKVKDIEEKTEVKKSTKKEAVKEEVKEEPKVIKTLEERKETLLKKGKEKGYITYEELAAELKDLELTADDLDDLYSTFTNSKIAVVTADEAGKGGNIEAMNGEEAVDKLIMSDEE